MSKTLREMFLAKLAEDFRHYLKDQPTFKNWSDTDIDDLASEIMDEKKTEINDFLNERGFSIKERNKAITDIMDNILIPAVSQLRI